MQFRYLNLSKHVLSLSTISPLSVSCAFLFSLYSPISAIWIGKFANWSGKRSKLRWN